MPRSSGPHVRLNGDLVSFHRKSAGFTQEKLGQLVGLSKASISAIENNRFGKSGEMLLTTATKLATALECTIEALIRNVSTTQEMEVSLSTYPEVLGALLDKITTTAPMIEQVLRDHQREITDLRQRIQALEAERTNQQNS